MKFANLKKFIYFASAISVLLIFISLKSAVCLENISMSTTDSQNLAKAKASIQNKIQANLKLKAKNRNKKTYSFESPPGTIGAAKADSDKLTASKNVPNLKQTPVILSNWLMISSRTFRNNKFFPDIFMGADIPNYKIKVDPYDYRLNDAFQKDNNKENSPANEKLFWFRLTKEHIFYSSTVSDLNILGGNKIDHIKNANALKKTPLGLFCFNMVDKAGHDWRLCSEDRLVRNKWYCQVQKLRGINVENYCNNHDEDGDNDGDGDGNGNNKNIIYKNIIQPYIIIPQPSHKCNEDWNYQSNGDDWECDCAEGVEQAPIDLPPKEKAIDSSASPIFKFSTVNPKIVKTLEGGRTRDTETLKIKLENNALRIDYQNFGRTVTPDGSVYDAEEIVIHTPAEHQIDGKKFPMELQIIHHGKSVGDIGKQLIVSFLFDKKAGVYNKFIDDLDFFNLPNPVSPVVDIVHDLFVPKLLYSSDDKENPTMHPFSFYTYQGSLTAPPCTEDTIMYVASKPIELGSTALHLFQEALRMPDFADEKGNINVSDIVPISNRNIQPLNGRPVFHYDHVKNCGPDKKKGKDGSDEDDFGHYEKINKMSTKYFFVPGNNVSGIPNAYVVSKNEALQVEN